MNKKDINLISEAYSKVGIVQESFNYMDFAKEVLNAAEEHMSDGVRHTFADVWDGNENYEITLNRYMEDVKDLISIADNLKRGNIEKVKKLYRNLDTGVKDYLPNTLNDLASQPSIEAETEEE